VRAEQAECGREHGSTIRRIPRTVRGRVAKCSDLGLRCTIVPRCSIPAGVAGLTLCSIKVGPISHGYTTANRFTPQADTGQLHLPHSASRDVKDIIAPRGMVLQEYPRRIALPCVLWSVFCGLCSVVCVLCSHDRGVLSYVEPGQI
jgi:hypothetical protein